MSIIPGFRLGSETQERDNNKNKTVPHQVTYQRSRTECCHRRNLTRQLSKNLIPGSGDKSAEGERERERERERRRERGSYDG